MSNRNNYFEPTPKTWVHRGIEYIEHHSSVIERNRPGRRGKEHQTSYAMPGRQGSYSRQQIIEINRYRANA